MSPFLEKELSLKCPALFMQHKPDAGVQPILFTRDSFELPPITVQHPLGGFMVSFKWVREKKKFGNSS